MAKIAQQTAEKGSQYWLQRSVALDSQLLSKAIKSAAGWGNAPTIFWLSPTRDDDFAEYRDSDFLDRLGVKLKIRPLGDFWPMGGPVWDGLGRTSDGQILLVEAKAHIPEMFSPPCKASEPALSLIRMSLEEAKRYYGAKSTVSWTETYYQYANRLAHLYLLRGLNNIPAWMVFVYFVNDRVMGGPSSIEQWEMAINEAHDALGLARDKLPHVIDVFVDVAPICSQP